MAAMPQATVGTVGQELLTKTTVPSEQVTVEGVGHVCVVKITVPSGQVVVVVVQTWGEKTTEPSAQIVLTGLQLCVDGTTEPPGHVIVAGAGQALPDGTTAPPGQLTVEMAAAAAAAGHVCAAGIVEPSGQVCVFTTQPPPPRPHVTPAKAAGDCRAASVMTATTPASIARLAPPEKSCRIRTMTTTSYSRTVLSAG